MPRRLVPAPPSSSRRCPRSACSARTNATRCTASPPATRWPWSTWTEPTELPEATAGQLMFGELFGRLSAGARSLLARTAAFRGPVAAGTVAARPAQIAECEAAGLLTVVSGRELAVHRWTAEQLRHQLAETGPPPARP